MGHPAAAVPLDQPNPCISALPSKSIHPQVLLEFKEYATEVDVDFVRKAVRAIGHCAVTIQSAAER